MRAPRRRVIRILGACLGLTALAAGCAPSGTTITEPEPVGPTVEPGARAQVALLLPQTGPNDGAIALARVLENAARMALAELGSAPIDLRVYDTAGTPAVAGPAAQAAIADGATLILGPLFSTATGAVKPIAETAGVTVVSFSTDSSIAGGTTFVSGYLPEAEAKRILGFARARGIETFGVLYPRTPYGNAAIEALRGAAVPGALVAELSYPRSFKGIEDSTIAFADLFRATVPDAILLPESGDGLRTVGAFLNNRGVGPGAVKYLGLGQWNAPTTPQEPALQGGWFPAPDPARVSAFASRYRASYGDTPPVLAVLSYDAVQIAAQLLEAAARDGANRPFLPRAMTRAGGFRGAVGPIRFLENGQSERGMAILEVESDGFRVVDPAPTTFGASS